MKRKKTLRALAALEEFALEWKGRQSLPELAIEAGGTLEPLVEYSSRFTSEALINEKPVPMPRPETRASPGSAVPLLSTVMLLAIIVTTTCQLRTGVARDMRT